MTTEDLTELFKKVQDSSATAEEKLLILKEMNSFVAGLNKALVEMVVTLEDNEKIQVLRKQILDTKK